MKPWNSETVECSKFDDKDVKLQQLAKLVYPKIIYTFFQCHLNFQFKFLIYTPCAHDEGALLRWAGSDNKFRDFMEVNGEINICVRKCGWKIIIKDNQCIESRCSRSNTTSNMILTLNSLKYNLIHLRLGPIIYFSYAFKKIALLNVEQLGEKMDRVQSGFLFDMAWRPPHAVLGQICLPKSQT